MIKENNIFKKLPPFKWFILQNFPFIEEDFDAITNYQLLCKIVEYLNLTIGKTNELGTQVENLTNWFNNLDVQEEINNKLDIMAEDGTLAEIINEQIFGELNERIEELGGSITDLSNAMNTMKDDLEDEIKTKISYIDTFSDLLESDNLQKDMYIETLGYYTKNDGGNAKYYITDTASETPNNYTTIELPNNLYAILDYKDKINVKQFGAKGDNTADDLVPLQACVNYTASKNIECYIPNGTYIIEGQLLLPNYATIIGEGRNTIIKTKDNLDLVYHTICTANASSINARLARNNNSSFISQGYPRVDEVCPYYVHDIILKNFSVNGNWPNRDLVNWDKIYTSQFGNVTREPGTGIELQRCYDVLIQDLFIYNSPQHNLNVRAGAYCYDEGNTIIADYPSYNILFERIEVNNQRYDDGITTHDSQYITIRDCYAHVDNNASGLYTQAISNGFEIDDGSRFVNVINCISRYSVSGFQAKGHNNTPVAHDIIFENCLAEYCHHGFTFEGTPSNNSTTYDNMTRNIYLNNCTAKNMYIFSNDSDWPDIAHDIEADDVTSLTINNFTSIAGVPTDSFVNNISSAPHVLQCRFRGVTYNIKMINAFLMNLKSLNQQRSYINIDGTSRNFIIKNVTADGFKNVPLIEYTQDSIYGYCILDSIILSKIDETTEIENVSSDVKGTRTNLLVIEP